MNDVKTIDTLSSSWEKSSSLWVWELKTLHQQLLHISDLFLKQDITTKEDKDKVTLLNDEISKTKEDISFADILLFKKPLESLTLTVEQVQEKFQMEQLYEFLREKASLTDYFTFDESSKTLLLTPSVNPITVQHVLWNVFDHQHDNYMIDYSSCTNIAIKTKMQNLLGGSSGILEYKNNSYLLKKSDGSIVSRRPLIWEGVSLQYIPLVKENKSLQQEKSEKNKVWEENKVKPVMDVQNIDVKKYGNTPAVRNNNPGNLRKQGDLGRDKKGFAIYSSPQKGWDELVNMISWIQQGNSRYYHPDMNLFEFFSTYAPKSDNNDPISYAKRVAGKLGIAPEEHIKNIEPDKFAVYIAQHEDGKSFRKLKDVWIITPDMLA